MFHGMSVVGHTVYKSNYQEYHYFKMNLSNTTISIFYRVDLKKKKKSCTTCCSSLLTTEPA